MKNEVKLTILVSLFVFIGCNEKRRKEVKKEQIESREITKVNFVDKDCSLDFNTFFLKFSKDSIFQKRRIKFPLKYLYYQDVTSNEAIIEYITKINYKYIDFSNDNGAAIKEYDKFTIEKKELKDKVIYKRLGLDNGIREAYEFEKKDGCWYLFLILDEST